MIDTLISFPLSFWVTALILVAGTTAAAFRLKDGTGLPCIAVLGTVAAWYVGDALYNDYTHNHALLFTADTLESAWWQVAWFCLVFLTLTPLLHKTINARVLHRSSHVYRLVQEGPLDPVFQRQLELLFKPTMIAWLVLVAIAIFKLGDQIPYYFFPFLGYKADPWVRGRIGTGLDFILAFAGYLQIMLAAIFGLVAALTNNRTVRLMAFGCILLSWPGYVFDRTRNSILAVVVPGILAWAFVRLRFNWIIKLAVLAGFFLIINAWLAFIIANRSNMSITSALNGEGISVQDAGKDSHHLGLNMFEELCWINKFIDDGEYKINWGSRYFAEIVNPIPRTIWKSKPMIGIDYAMVRGQTSRSGDDTDASGVYTTISTGMIGQGVVNFGLFFGPAFAAFLMSLWAVTLARLDLKGDNIGCTPLYALGTILTFNLGRDITLITLYTFLFGLALVWWLNKNATPQGRRQMAVNY